MNTKKLTILGVLLALSIVGAEIKIFGSVALDSFPAFLAALLLGPIQGGIIAIVGHLISATLASFPLSIPIHIIIGVMMGLSAFLFGKTYRLFKDKIKANIASIIVGYLMNVVIALILLYPLIHSAVFIYFIPLSVACIINLILACVIYQTLKNRIKL